MLKVAATEMVSGVSGESEHKLRELFEQAVVRHPLEITLCIVCPFLCKDSYFVAVVRI